MYRAAFFCRCRWGAATMFDTANATQSSGVGEDAWTIWIMSDKDVSYSWHAKHWKKVTMQNERTTSEKQFRSCKRSKAFAYLLNSVRKLCSLLLQHGHEWYSCNVTFNFTRGVWYINDWIQQLAVHICSLNQLILTMDGVEWKDSGLPRKGESDGSIKLMILQGELAAKDNKVKHPM
jgi:hypothetical protein